MNSCSTQNTLNTWSKLPIFKTSLVSGCFIVDILYYEIGAFRCRHPVYVRRKFKNIPSRLNHTYTLNKYAEVTRVLVEVCFVRAIVW
jgi:hypothetical protein